MSEYIIDWDENLVIDTFSKNSLRQEIVRCRDCAYSFDGGSRCRKWRGQDCFENSLPEHVQPDGFCAWGGERRTAVP